MFGDEYPEISEEKAKDIVNAFADDFSRKRQIELLIWTPRIEQVLKEDGKLVIDINRLLTLLELKGIIITEDNASAFSAEDIIEDLAKEDRLQILKQHNAFSDLVHDREDVLKKTDLDDVINELIRVSKMKVCITEPTRTKYTSFYSFLNLYYTPDREGQRLEHSIWTPRIEQVLKEDGKLHIDVNRLLTLVEKMDLTNVINELIRASKVEVNITKPTWTKYAPFCLPFTLHYIPFWEGHYEKAKARIDKWEKEHPGGA